MKNYQRTIISQYKDSPRLVGLLDNFNQYFDPCVDLRNLYDTLWNVQTASGYGLDVWGRIVGVSRNLQVSNVYGFFGFAEATGTEPFGSGVFYTGGPVSGATQVALTDDAFRQLILLKALVNVTNCSAATLNAVLAQLYGSRGRCYVIDNGDMTFTFRFEFYLTPVDESILIQSGVLPRPAGVKYTIVQGF